MLNSNSSQAKTFFDDINIMEKEKGFELLKNLIDKENKFYEQDWIDFKGAPKQNDMKKIWSKAISGYANSCDGIIVWGIDARKDEDTNIDYASELSLVDEPEIFKSRLQELQRQSTDPPVGNIEYWHAFDPDNKDKGFVVCFIPESPFKPYRADAAGRNYYIRAGDSFQVPSVSLLKRLFYPEFHAFLWPELRAKKEESKIIVEGYIHNSGVGTAKNVVIAMETDSNLGDFSMVDNSWNVVDHNAVENKNQSAAFSLINPIHPGIVNHFFHFTISQADINKACNNYSKPFIFKFIFYSEDNKPLFSYVSFDQVNFDDFVDFGIKDGKENTKYLEDKYYNTYLRRIPIS